MSEELFKFTHEKLRSVQLKELDTLVYFKDFCEKNNLQFFVCGGCAIGSLRSHGFLPWDDDIDVLMPREDYERLYRMWNRTNDEQKRFRLLRTDSVMFTGNIFTTIVDTETTCIKANQAHLDIPFGLMLDVFPLDGCPKGRLKRTLQKINAMVYSLFMAQIVPEKHGGILALGSRILLSVFRSQKTRERIWRSAERRMTKYKISESDCITELCEGVHSMQNEYPKELFSSAVYSDFEGIKIPIPVGYDTYLTMAFGDYMTPPPNEEQIPHHDMVFCDPNNGYEKYRGIYFDKKQEKEQ